MYPLVINLRIGISSGNFLPRMFICFSHAYETSLVFFHAGTVEGGPMCIFFFFYLLEVNPMLEKVAEQPCLWGF